MWPKGMPQPPEGLRWKASKSQEDYVRIKLVSKWGKVVEWSVVKLPYGHSVEDVDQDVIYVAAYILHRYAAKVNTTLRDDQLARVEAYGEWEG